MNRLEVIQKFINKFNYKSYLEIGVDNGSNFRGVKIAQKESIDPAEGQYRNSRPTYKMTSDEFFKKYPNNFYDIIFIDGLHIHEQVDKDIANSINQLNPNGVVLLHDCCPPSEEAQRVPRGNIKLWTGDVWKSIVKFNYYNYKNFNTYVINTDLGIGVIQRGEGRCNYKLPNELTYDWFVDNKTEALNLIPVDEFNSRV